MIGACCRKKYWKTSCWLASAAQRRVWTPTPTTLIELAGHSVPVARDIAPAAAELPDELEVLGYLSGWGSPSALGIGVIFGLGQVHKQSFIADVVLRTPF